MSAHTISTVSEFTSVQSQYETQVAADLERNTAEQERLRAEIDTLQGQLETLEHDHTLLLGVQRVFADGAGADAARGAKVPGARTANRAAKSAAGSAEAPKTSKYSKSSKGSAKTAGGAAAKAASGKARKGAKTPAKPAGAASGSAGATGKQPSLAQLVGTLLAAHAEPRSAAEVAAELAADHPGRNSNINVVRNALELLVAKSEAHRAKQNKSVFYTYAGRDEVAVPAVPAVPAPDADATPAAG
ncbi:hypothetical protein [Streptomyces sp. NBC_01506]|uniref:hypothetical protein n=1 Tax=Streptomyces sp. NBC_01506 TaxID=2903887 RepID=UPI0038656676